MTKNSARFLWIALLALVLLGVPALEACPNCSSSVPMDAAGGGGGAGAAAARSYSDGINQSIYFMIGAIYSVMGLFGFGFYRAYRNYQPGLATIRLGDTSFRNELAPVYAAAGKESRK